MYTRWRRWCRAGRWVRLFKKLAAGGFGRIALDRPIALQLAPGHRHDLKACAGLWQELRSGWLAADRASDSDQFRASLAALGLAVCIPARANRRRSYAFYPTLYAHRHTVENANARLKRFLRIGTRYETLAVTFLGFVLLAASLTGSSPRFEDTP